MTLAFILLFISALLIYLSSEYFVNGIEWVGHHLNISQHATGTILAAFGTALPESIVTFVAVVFGDTPDDKSIGVGAAIGGPLVLSTIAYSVVGIIFLLLKSSKSNSLITKTTELRLGYNQMWFMWIFVFKIALGLIAISIKPFLGVFFIAAYLIYIKQEMQGSDDPEHYEFKEPLRFSPNGKNHKLMTYLQTGLSLIVVFMSSKLFVHQLEVLSPQLGIPGQLVALLLSPVATELPEIMNAIIWVRQGKQNLALANVSGSMMIQATIPSALGMFFTPWILNSSSVWAALITMSSIVGLYCLLRKSQLTPKKLASFSVWYIVFGCGLFFI
jgi:cation:H+ antiporter